MSQPRPHFARALAGLIDGYLDDGATIFHVAVGLRLQLAVLGDVLDQDRRYLPELLAPCLFDPNRPADGREVFLEINGEGGGHAQFR